MVQGLELSTSTTGATGVDALSGNSDPTSHTVQQKKPLYFPSQKWKTDMVYSHIHVAFRKYELAETEEWWLPGAKG